MPTFRHYHRLPGKNKTKTQKSCNCFPVKGAGPLEKTDEGISQSVIRLERREMSVCRTGDSKVARGGRMGARYSQENQLLCSEQAHSLAGKHQEEPVGLHPLCTQWVLSESPLSLSQGTRHAHKPCHAPVLQWGTQRGRGGRSSKCGALAVFSRSASGG